MDLCYPTSAIAAIFAHQLPTTFPCATPAPATELWRTHTPSSHALPERPRRVSVMSPISSRCSVSGRRGIDGDQWSPPTVGGLPRHLTLWGRRDGRMGVCFSPAPGGGSATRGRPSRPDGIGQVEPILTHVLDGRSTSLGTSTTAVLVLVRPLRIEPPRSKLCRRSHVPLGDTRTLCLVAASVARQE